VRPLELALAGVCALAVLFPAVTGKRSPRGLMALVLVAVLAAQLIIEGYRWQLPLLYVVALGLALGDVFSVERELVWWRRLSRPILGLVGVAVMILPAILLPVPEFPAPDGPFAVGTTTIQLSFPDREEPYGPNPGQTGRRVMVQIWYPAEVGAGSDQVTWNPDLDVVGPAASHRLGLPGFFLDHTIYSNAHAIPSASPVEGTFPVVIRSHAYGGFRLDDLNQLESLASAGLVVLSVDHTYASAAVRFPDDTVYELDPAAIPDPATLEDEDAYQEAITTLNKTMDDDLVGVVDALAVGAAGPFGDLAEHADLGLLGVFGLEAGGGAAIRFCLTDVRCRAVLGMDAWVEPVPDRIMATEAQVPMLFMRSEEWQATENDGRLRGLSERSASVTYWIGIDGAEKNDFTFVPLLSPVAGRFGLKGPIPPERILPIIDRYLTGFFETVLLGTGSAAVESSPYPEVTVEIIDNR
jgi:hypothetical protein